MNVANPALAQTVMAGGRRRSMRRRGGKRCWTRRMRGGAYGYAVDPSVSVGGQGPNVAALHSPVPCDPRAGTLGVVTGSPDPRAPADLYSLSSRQAGGAYSGNAYGADCYRATGSQLPVYNAESAGFHFRPSTEIGSTLPDGVTAYNDVVPHAARMGLVATAAPLKGGRRRKSQRKRRNHRKHH